MIAALACGKASATPSFYSPDAWIRANNADTSYFGWDRLEVAGPPNLNFTYILDDSTPDLGAGITATNTRIFQGTNGAADYSPPLNGHVSGSGNYYSIFDASDDTITGVAPASGAGGFTTVVLQVHSSPNGSVLTDLAFDIDDSVHTWTLHKHLNNAAIPGLGNHWIEWSTPGANVPFSIKMTSSQQHRTIDSFEIDTFWSPTAAAVNAITVVPEPTGLVLLVIGLGIAVGRRRPAR